jgi:hypothetical protein
MDDLELSSEIILTDKDKQFWLYRMNILPAFHLAPSLKQPGDLTHLKFENRLRSFRLQGL